MRETVNWFLEDVAEVLTFKPGRTRGTFVVRPSLPAARLVQLAVEASHGLLPDSLEARLGALAHASQAFERISVIEGLKILCGYGETPGNLGQDDDYLARHGATADVLAAHRFVIR